MRSLWVLAKRVHTTLCCLMGTLNGSPFPSPVSLPIYLVEIILLFQCLIGKVTMCRYRFACMDVCMRTNIKCVFVRPSFKWTLHLSAYFLTSPSLATHLLSCSALKAWWSLPFLSLILFFNNLSGRLSYSTLITLFQLISRTLLHSSIYTATPSFNAITCLSGATGSAVAVGGPGNYSYFCFLVLSNMHSR